MYTNKRGRVSNCACNRHLEGSPTFTWHSYMVVALGCNVQLMVAHCPTSANTITWPLSLLLCNSVLKSQQTLDTAMYSGCSIYAVRYSIEGDSPSVAIYSCVLVCTCRDLNLIVSLINMYTVYVVLYRIINGIKIAVCCLGIDYAHLYCICVRFFIATCWIAFCYSMVVLEYSLLFSFCVFKHWVFVCIHSVLSLIKLS